MLAYKAKESVPSPDIVRLAEEDAHVVLAILQALGPAARDENGGIREEVGATMKPSHIAPLYSWLSLARVGPRPYAQNGQARKEAAVAKQEGRIPFLKPGRCQDNFPHLNFPLSSDSSFSLTCAPALPMIADIDPSPSPRWQQIASWPHC